MNPARVLVIGAGIGGLTTAAALAKDGFDVTVLEAHVYPGGCAGTFYHQKYRFDAGATLAGGFYPGGPMDLAAQAAGIPAWETLPHDPALPTMTVHLPNATRVHRWADDRRHEEHARAFGRAGENFFRWQEQTADHLWNFALRLPHFPPQTLADARDVAAKTFNWFTSDPRRLNPALLADAFLPAAAHLRGAPEALRQFVDGQLLIAAQTVSAHANALYAAAALDLPRRGVAHLRGGMGAIAQTLAQAVKTHGGRVLYRHTVTAVRCNGRGWRVHTPRGEFEADFVVINLPPWNAAELLGEDAPPKLKHLPEQPRDGWGAFMAYVGVPAALIPPDTALHHQIINPPLPPGEGLGVRVGAPFGDDKRWGEGNTVFLSISPAEDTDRAPAGLRAITLSTHTALAAWWQLHAENPVAYEARKQAYLEKLLAAAEIALPGIRAAQTFAMPGTPLTFARFTRRKWGWVGGFPQTGLFRTWGPRLRSMPNLWLVGDSIFPGQSAAAVALGGLRVAAQLRGAAAPASPRVFSLSARHQPARRANSKVAASTSGGKHPSST
ncbi:MAG: NAD(P)/FAD-dependent oxidoreductase [Anaerolineales bacterium]